MTLINVTKFLTIFTCSHLLPVGAAPIANFGEVEADGHGTGGTSLRQINAYATSDAVVKEPDEPAWNQACLAAEYAELECVTQACKKCLGAAFDDLSPDPTCDDFSATGTFCADVYNCVMGVCAAAHTDCADEVALVAAACVPEDCGICVGMPIRPGAPTDETSDDVEPDEPGQLSAVDRLRALTPRPLPTSHVHGSDARTAYAAMNVHLTDTEPVQVAPCAIFTHATLNAVSRTLFALREDKLQRIYVNVADKRALHFQSIEYKEKLWDRAPLTDTMRDGKCAEAVMWYIHHLSQQQRQSLAMVDDFVLPLMPEDEASIEAQEAEFDGGSEYRELTSCGACHW